MSFGFSIGDFLAVGTLIKDICRCLQDNKGSAAEYQELLRELECLQRALCHLDKLQNGSLPTTTLDSIKYAALSCRHPLKQFLRKIQKYDTSLGIWRKDGAVKNTLNKLRWGFVEKEEVSKLQSYINIHIGTINILLAEHGLEKLTLATDRVTADQLGIRERLSETHDIIKKCSASLAAQTMVLQTTHGMLGTLCKMINGEFRTSWMALEEMVAKVCVSTQQIYTVLVEIKTSLAGPDIRWTFFQAPFLVEDTFGHKFPVPSEYDFGLLDAVVKHKFSTGPGSAEVYNGNYEYFKTKDSNTSISGNSRLFPGMAITMAVIFPRLKSINDICPTSGCKSSNLIEMPSGGKACSECDVWFSPADKKLESSQGLILANYMVSDATVVELQSGNNANPRKRAASPLAEDEVRFKNIRLSCTEPAKVLMFSDDELLNLNNVVAQCSEVATKISGTFTIVDGVQLIYTWSPKEITEQFAIELKTGELGEKSLDPQQVKRCLSVVEELRTVFHGKIQDGQMLLPDIDFKEAVDKIANIIRRGGGKEGPRERAIYRRS